MCTAINWKTRQHYFGRNLDLDYSYVETVTITPRNYPFSFRYQGHLEHHYAIIGMAYVVEEYPLYYDATNEKGVSMAGLLFPGSAHYMEYTEGKDTIAPFEFIPWILAQCGSMQEVRALLEKLSLISESFSKELQVTPMHWMISYKEESIVVEAETTGLHIYENPVGVLTNAPSFPIQLWNQSNTAGVPGELSSSARFVRAAFVRNHSVSGESEEESVGQFFHMLASVEQQRGCNRMEQGGYEITQYSSCCNTDLGIYYYTTYENRQINAVRMHEENLEGVRLHSYSLQKKESVNFIN